jgi:energy-converting hydrogenase Eha subunit A
MSDAAPPPRGRSRLALGVICLVLGVGLLALNLGVQVPWQLWSYFPVPLIALGVWGMVSPTRHLDRIGGIWLLATGIYCLIGVFELFGLGWSSAWPIFIVATGLAVIQHRDQSCGTRNRSATGDE